MPTSDWTNAWIELTTPLRVRNVPKQRQRERGRHQHHVPDLQHPLLLLHHHRVQERGGRQPRHQRGVLDRIPGPVAAPADLDVRPVRAQQHADAQARPREQRPAADGHQPACVGAARDQRGHRECERHGQRDVAQVQHRRVGDHVRVLQGRVEAEPVGRRPARGRGERRRHERRHRREEHHDPAQHRGHPRHQLAVAVPVGQHHHASRRRPAPSATAAASRAGSPRTRSAGTRWAAAGWSCRRRCRSRSRGGRARSAAHAAATSVAPKRRDHRVARRWPSAAGHGAGRRTAPPASRRPPARRRRAARRCRPWPNARTPSRRSSTCSGTW